MISLMEIKLYLGSACEASIYLVEYTGCFVLLWITLKTFIFVPWKSLLRTSESSRFLNYDLRTNFDVLKKKRKKKLTESWKSHWVFFRRLVRPAYVTFLKTGWWNSNGCTSGIHWCIYHNQKVVFRWSPRSSK